MRRVEARVRGTVGESAALALDALRRETARSALAVAGVVIGIVTLVLVTSVLAGLRAQVGLLFREFGTDNVFAYHLTGDPYSPPSEEEANRRPLEPAFAAAIAREASHVRDVGVQVIVPAVRGERVLVARGGGRESDTVVVEGLSANFFDVTGAEFLAGRPFTELEDRSAARVAVVGANVARALYGSGRSVGQILLLGGERLTVVGESAPRRGGFFGENRQDNVVAIPQGTAARLFPDAEDTVLYVRSRPGRREEALRETEAALRRLRQLGPAQPSDFHLSTAEQIIALFDRLAGVIGLATIALAAVSLVIGGIGVANVMVIGVTERTQEIGLRRALGARRRDVLGQFLLEAAILSGAGGLIGVLLAALLDLAVSLLAPGMSAMPPPWVVGAGLVASLGTGLLAGWLPARRAAAVDPAEALRYE